MADLATLQARLEKLKAARDSGVLSLRDGDRSLQHYTMAELMKAIEALEAEIATADGKPRRRVRYPYQASRGL